MPATLYTEIHVSSAPMICSPGVWKWFEHARKTQNPTWCAEFLKAFTCDRITPEQISHVLNGSYTTREEKNEVLVLVLCT